MGARSAMRRAPTWRALCLAHAVLVGAAFCLLPAVVEAQPAGPAAVAGIDVSRSAGGLVLKAEALALTAGNYDVSMKIDRRSGSNRMTSRQHETLRLDAGARGTAATVGVSFQPGDAIEVSVEVSAQGHEISRAQLSLK